MSAPSCSAPHPMVIATQGAIMFDQASLPSAHRTLFDPAAYQHAERIGQGGRGAAWYVSLPWGEAVLRHYRRGGLVAHWSQDRYLWMGAKATRSFAEFRVLAHLYEQGCQVPRPLAAAWWRQRLTYRAAISVERIPLAQSLAYYVTQAAEPTQSELAQAVVRAIHAMHEANVWHADLN